MNMKKINYQAELIPAYAIRTGRKLGKATGVYLNVHEDCDSKLQHSYYCIG